MDRNILDFQELFRHSQETTNTYFFCFVFLDSNAAQNRISVMQTCRQFLCCGFDSHPTAGKGKFVVLRPSLVPDIQPIKEKKTTHRFCYSARDPTMRSGKARKCSKRHPSVPLNTMSSLVFHKNMKPSN